MAQTSSPTPATLPCRMMADPNMLITTGISSQALQQQASIFLQFYLLALRSSKNMWRNSLILKAKLAQVGSILRS